MKLEDFFILSLAVWRLTSFLVHEDGPFQVFLWIRHKAGIRYDERSVPYPTNELSRGLSCFWCTSVWVACVVALCYYLWQNIVVGLAVPFALSALAIVADEHVGQNNDT